MPSDTDKIIQNLSATLEPFDKEIFLESAATLRLLSARELRMYLQNPASRPELSTSLDHLDQRLLVLGRGLVIEMTTEAAIKPENDPKGEAASKLALSKEEQAAIDTTNACMAAIENEIGEKRRQSSNNLLAARKKLSLAEIEANAAASNGSIGSAAQLAAKQAVTVARNGVRAHETEDRKLHAQYVGAMRSLTTPGRSGNNDPLGLLPQDPATAPKPPPI